MMQLDVRALAIFRLAVFCSLYNYIQIHKLLKLQRFGSGLRNITVYIVRSVVLTSQLTSDDNLISVDVYSRAVDHYTTYVLLNVRC
jgi:hypothetical protein